MDLVLWKILLVDDDEDDYVYVRQLLLEASHRQFELEWAQTYEAGLRALQSNCYDAILMDYDLGLHSGLELIHAAVACKIQAPIILYTGRGSYEVDEEAMQAGATMYLTKKEANPLLLERAIRYAIEHKQTQAALSKANEELKQELEKCEQTEALLEVRNQSLWLSENSLRSVLDNSLDVIYRLNLQTRRYEYFSPACQTVYGFSPEEMMAMSSEETMDRVHPDDRSQVVITLPRIQAEGLGHLAFRWRKKTGEFRWLSVNLKFTRDAAGHWLYRDGIVRDITESKQFEAVLISKEKELADANEELEIINEELKSANEELLLQQESLRQSEERYRDLVECSNSIIMRADKDLNIRYMNEFGLKYFGYTAQELIGKNVIGTTIPKKDDAGRDLEAMAKDIVQQPGQYITNVHKNMRKNGELVWISWTNNVKYDSEGNVVEILAVGNDIYQLKKAEEALKVSEHRFRQLAEASFEGLLIHESGRIIDANTVIVKMLGYDDPSALIDRDLLGYVDPTYHKLMTKGLRTPFEIEVVHRNGSRIPVEVIAKPFVKEGQVVVAVLDLRERKKAEAALRESEAKYRALIQYAPSGIYEIDFRSKRFTSVNEALCQLSGYSQDELLQMNPLDILDEQSQRVFQERLTRWLAGEKPDENVEYRVRAKDGHEIYADLNVTFTKDENGKPLGATVIGHDITARKQAEAMMKAQNEAIQDYAKKLEQSNKELENFALIASHDLREPLRKIEQFGDQLAKSASPSLGETERDYLRRMQNAAARLNKMIEDLLVLSRVAIQGQPFCRVDLNRVARDVLDDLNSQVRKTGARVDHGELPVIQADPIQMHQLFQNLISNALKFHKAGEPPIV
ncbi:MAG: PAS domain S-box protein, partial [Chloroflexota bacterium]